MAFTRNTLIWFVVLDDIFDELIEQFSGLVATPDLLDFNDGCDLLLILFLEVDA